MLTIVLYELMIINIQIFIDKKIIKFLNIVYISNFMMNIVFENILEEKELHFDIQHRYRH